MQTDKDKHQDEIISMQENYNKKIKAHKIEIDSLKQKIIELEEEQLSSRREALVHTSAKPDEGWDIQIETDNEKTQLNEKLEHDLKLKNEDIIQLQNQVKIT